MQKSQCPHCQSTEDQTIYGRTLRGSQRYKCRQCARVCTPDPRPLGYPDETKREAVHLYLEGVNFRRIGRVLGVNHQSVINWINSYHAALPASEQLVAAPEVVELDELASSPEAPETPVHELQFPLPRLQSIS